MMRQKAQKDRRFSVLWERVIKAVSVFAFNPSTLVGLVFLIVLMQGVPKATSDIKGYNVN
jgi:hypothetical protein